MLARAVVMIAVFANTTALFPDMETRLSKMVVPAATAMATISLQAFMRDQYQRRM